MRVSGKRVFWIYILVMLISRPLSYIYMAMCAAGESAAPRGWYMSRQQ